MFHMLILVILVIRYICVTWKLKRSWSGLHGLNRTVLLSDQAYDCFHWSGSSWKSWWDRN